MHNIKWKRNMKKFVHQAVTFLTVVMTLFPTSLALLLSRGATAKAEDVDPFYINLDKESGSYYVGTSSNPFYVYCMNNKLKWPDYEGGVKYTKSDETVMPSDFKSQADYEAFQKNGDTFWKQLKAILILGYPNNALNLYTLGSQEGEVSEAELNAKLVPPDFLRTDFPDSIGSKTFTYTKGSGVSNKASLQEFSQELFNLYFTGGKTASGHTLSEIYATPFYKAVSLVMNNKDPLAKSEYSFQFKVGTVMSAQNAAKQTQAAVWTLMDKYGFKQNDGSVNLNEFGQQLLDEAVTLKILKSKPSSSDIKITGDTTFTYQDGEWVSGELEIKEPDGYNGVYNLNLDNLGMRLKDGGSTVTGGQKFQLVSDYEPVTSLKLSASANIMYLTETNIYHPEASDTIHQSMIGARFATATVSTSTSYDVKYDGALKIYKYVKGSDGKADTSKPVRGVRFSVASTTDPSKTQTVTTDEKGTATLTDLTPGDYTVTETSVEKSDPVVEMPTSDSEKSQKVTVKADKTAITKVQFSDKVVKKEEDKGNLEISKYAKGEDGKADTSNPVKGVEFTITGPDGHSVKKETGADGKISLSDLTPGYYTITETSVAKSNPVVEMPTSDSEKSQKVKVEADKTATTKVQFSDKLVKKEEDKGNLEISKYVKKDDGSADTSNPVKGVEFTITGPDGSSVTKETDENGQISLTDLTPGEYTVTETSVAKSNPVVEMPTSDSEKSQKVKVEADKKAITKVQFSDKLKPETPSKPETPEKTGTFTVQKYIEGTTTSVAGVQFKITGPDAQVNGKTYETGSDGKIKMPSSLKAGTYTVFELTKPGKGFLDNVVLKEQSQTITIKSDGTTDKANGVLTFYDAKKETTKPEAKTGTFMIQKYIKNTSTGVPGVQFQITGPDDQVNKKTFTTDSNGQVKLPDSLKPGEYTVTELTTAGTGFNDTVQLVSQTQKVMIAEDGTTKLPSNVMTFYDEAKPVTPTQPVDQKGSLLIQKYIEGTKTGVAGVQFTVAGPNGSKTYTTNTSGQIVLSSLKLGKYVVTEQTTAGEGFKDEVVLTSQSKSVELGANNLSDTLTFYDAKKPTTPSTPEKPESEKPTTPEKPESETPTTPEKPESETPTTPEKPESEKPTTPEKPESETPTTPEKPESEKPSTPKKSKSEKPKKTTKKKASKKKTPSLPGSPGTPSLPGSPGTSGQSSSSAQSSGSKQSQSASGLPQTGEADSMILIVLGLLIAFSAMLIFYYVEKKSK